MKILIADADADFCRFLETALAGWGYEVVVTSDGTEASKALQDKLAPRLAILDSTKQGVGGIQICREIRKRGQQPYVYVILLAAKDQKQDIMEGMEAGADDYLFRPFEAYELRVRLRLARRILELREELLQAQEGIAYQVYHDPLTGLWNRTAIIDILRREVARAGREGTPVAVIMAAIDGLKSINDAYGHMAGNHVVRITARRFRSSLRAYDAIGRYGGGEFLVIVPRCDARSALKQAERLQACISERPIEIPQGGKFSHSEESMMSVTLSLGVAVGAGENEAESLLHAAEAAANRARSGGANRIEQQATIPQATSGP